MSNELAERCEADREALAERLRPLLDARGAYYACPFCEDDFMDLTGFAYHLHVRCEVVEALSNEHGRLCRESDERFHAAALRARKDTPDAR